ncbi:hypothetical protein CFREI_09605 [Corynebacterium freiburgense]|nr:hypothetical protein CFREI_09605 [Corynebacterium freiburgense]
MQTLFTPIARKMVYLATLLIFRSLYLSAGQLKFPLPANPALQPDASIAPFLTAAT